MHPVDPFCLVFPTSLRVRQIKGKGARWRKWGRDTQDFLRLDL